VALVSSEQSQKSSRRKLSGVRWALVLLTSTAETRTSHLTIHRFRILLGRFFPQKVLVNVGGASPVQPLMAAVNRNMFDAGVVAESLYRGRPSMMRLPLNLIAQIVSYVGGQ
jgi:hypothetical protein